MVELKKETATNVTEEQANSVSLSKDEQAVTEEQANSVSLSKDEQAVTEVTTEYREIEWGDVGHEILKFFLLCLLVILRCYTVRY